MGNSASHPSEEEDYRGFPGSAIVDSITAPCGKLSDTFTESPKGSNQPTLTRFLNQAEALCIQSPTSETGNKEFEDEYEDFRRDHDSDEDSYKRPPPSPAHPTSALFARALVNEVTDNPKTMPPAAMAEREKMLLKAQERASKLRNSGDENQPRPVGVPGGSGQPSVLSTIANAMGNPDLAAPDKSAPSSVLPPNSISENRALVDSSATPEPNPAPGKYTVTIGLSLSRRSSTGHSDTVTRQTAFDFNELQDREYKYVSSTDPSGWRAGGGEAGGPPLSPLAEETPAADGTIQVKPLTPTTTGPNHKTAAPDTVHIPIIQIDAESPQAIDAIIAALARGEIFIPHMAITPEALSVDGVSPPDLVVRFGTERNDDLPPDEWPNWCLEFMHNQLYEYFYTMGARWSKRPFSITLAKKVRWKTVKHMNRYFAHAERVIDAWREKGPQYLDPQLEGSSIEVARPHGIYLLRNGVPTNYFPPNFDPPYTTKMTRSLLQNVMDKSWDKKRREWTSEPVPRLVTPAMLVTAMCGCGDSNAGGFVANEVTLKNKIDTSTIPRNATSSPSPAAAAEQPSLPPKPASTSQPEKVIPPTPGTEAADTDIMSEAVVARPEKAQPEMEPDISSPKSGFSQGKSDTDSSIKPQETVIPPKVSSPKVSDEKPPVGLRRQETPEAAVSEMGQPSVSGTNSTIMHMNLSAGNFVQREMERHMTRDEKKEEDPRRLVSDEDWLDDMGKPLPSPAVILTEKDKVKEALDEERARQSTLLAMAQEQTKVEKQPTKRSNPPSINKNNSGVSLEYSVDDSTFNGDGSTLGGSSLLGGKFATDGSVASKATNQTSTPSNQAQPKEQPTTDEDDASAFSLQESTSSMEVVPSDEELFAVGWAKALDPKSGSYYYFTLDRTKIVWDNPLATGGDSESAI
eukprot:Nitzschia sp. Nitz4//scaffold24_size164493//44140//46958//NITZ4_002316-RA/size164493-snap-gene-0.2-mRNA-1//1//CDS//3329544078//9059//frame0